MKTSVFVKFPCLVETELYRSLTLTLMLVRTIARLQWIHLFVLTLSETECLVVLNKEFDSFSAFSSSFLRMRLSLYSFRNMSSKPF